MIRWQRLGGVFLGGGMLCLCLFVLVSGPQPAQAQSSIAFDLHIFGDLDATTSLALGDLDGDGTLDLVVGNANGAHNRIYLNDSSGRFDDSMAFGSADEDTTDLAVGDLNGDGALDIIVANQVQPNAVYFNDGAGNVSLAYTFGITENTQSVAIGDLNGDGVLDVVVGNEYELNQVYLNDGTGHFSDTLILPDNNYYSQVAIGDFNNDEWLDMAANEIFINQGNPISFTMLTTYIALDGKPSLVDLNKDGSLDIIAPRTEPAQDQRCLNQFPHNSDSVAFNCITFGSLLNTWSTTSGDINNDGNMDVVTVGDENIIYLGDGSGAFPESIELLSLYDTRDVLLGDVNGDGWLDVVLGNYNEENQVYLNRGGLVFQDIIEQPDLFAQTPVLGDFNGDTYLDMIGMYNQTNPVAYYAQVNLNQGEGILEATANLSVTNRTNDSVVGDFNNDNILDVALAVRYQDMRIYWNDGLGNFSTPTWISNTENGSYISKLATGDFDANGTLDLVNVRYGADSQIILNHADGFEVRSLHITTDTLDVVAGDLNSDGTLDLVISVNNQRNIVFFNAGDGTFPITSTFGNAGYSNGVLVLGDLDGNGSLDVVAGDNKTPSTVYFNPGNGYFSSSEEVGTYIHPQMALADVNNDSYLDIVGSRKATYLNNGIGDFSISLYPDNFNLGQAVLGDFNNDGTSDAIVYSKGTRLHRTPLQTPDLLAQMPYLHINTPMQAVAPMPYVSTEILDNPVIPISYTLFDMDSDDVGYIKAYYSPNGGGRWLPAVAASHTVTQNLSTDMPPHYVNTTVTGIGEKYSPSTVVSTSSQLVIRGTQSINDINVWLDIKHSPVGNLEAVLESPNGTHVPLFAGVGNDGADFSNTMFDDEAALSIISGTAPFSDTYRPMGILADFDGESPGGTWSLWVTDTNKVYGSHGSINSWGLDIDAGDGQHIYYWDTAASGFVGESNNVVFRIEAYPQPIYTGITNTYRYTHTLANYNLWSYASASTYPFNVRGTQIRVYSETATPGNEVANAFVYRRAPNTPVATPLQTQAGLTLRTNTRGYLQGQEPIYQGDQLIALLPITHTDTYTFYNTSAQPTLVGVDAYTYTQTGIQTLTVSAANPFLLFNLDVSLEWDARNDPNYLQQLESDVYRVSSILYDLSNGQMALGDVHIYQAQEQWLDADVVIYAANDVRPNANMGGVVSQPVAELGTAQPISNAYLPGQVRMGAIWNRFGQTQGSIGEDWPRALAHELAHYLGFLPDNYLGVRDGLVIHTQCQGSAMTDPYVDAYSEFLTAENWQGECLDTLAAQTTGRADWETLQTFYPMLHAGTNTGPATLPLDVTHITLVTPTTDTQTLAAPFFSILNALGQPQILSQQARAYLFKNLAYLSSESASVIVLGSPNGDIIQARGAVPGDRLCVYEQAASELRSGCLTIGTTVGSIIITEQPDWYPEINVTPVTSRTFTISVTQPGDEQLNVQLLPSVGPASPETAMLSLGAGIFSQTVTLSAPAFSGFVRVWATGEGTREMLAEFALGEGWDAMRRGWGAMRRGWGAMRRGWGAPVTSADGQAIIYNIENILAPDINYTLQTLALPPDLPTWLTPVGQAYHFNMSQVLSDTVLTLNYLQRNVPGGQEYGLTIYYLADGTTIWQRLPTTLDMYRNFAAAAVPGEGIYVLIATIEMPALEPGWNGFGYPVPETRPITRALASIDGKYTSVYHYQPADVWRLYDQTVVDEHPEFTSLVNDLAVLTFGQAYWIYATDYVTPYLQVPTTTRAAMDVQTTQLPPATFYGWITNNATLTPTPGMTVTAHIGSHLCGQSQVALFDGRLAYKLQVSTEGAEAVGCGATGRQVTFAIGDQAIGTPQPWDNSQAWFYELGAGGVHYLYLPCILKNQF
ncbi:MAG: VCBS repeat-containing protein [Anaerolineae bacterium]|nr:VCBS repeat-containing protein [Anaerolineae bacterium]